LAGRTAWGQPDLSLCMRTDVGSYTFSFLESHLLLCLDQELSQIRAAACGLQGAHHQVHTPWGARAQLVYCLYSYLQALLVLQVQYSTTGGRLRQNERSKLQAAPGQSCYTVINTATFLLAGSA
jgi:hypothetical protein